MRSIIPTADHSESSVRLKNRSQSIKALTALSLSLAVYGMVGWIYVAICGLVAPDTLHWPLTHLLPHLREDTSGVISFIVSFIGFLVYWIVRDNLCNLSGFATSVLPGCLYGRSTTPTVILRAWSHRYAMETLPFRSYAGWLANPATAARHWRARLRQGLLAACDAIRPKDRAGGRPLPARAHTAPACSLRAAAAQPARADDPDGARNLLNTADPRRPARPGREVLADLPTAPTDGLRGWPTSTASYGPSTDSSARTGTPDGGESGLRPVICALGQCASVNQQARAGSGQFSFSRSR